MIGFAFFPVPVCCGLITLRFTSELLHTIPLLYQTAESNHYKKTHVLFMLEITCTFSNHTGVRISIPYTAIHSAVSQRRTFQLHYNSVDHTPATLEVKCDSTIGATEVYRALTEKHAFYSCETVRGAVTSQFVRDLKVRITYCYISHTTFYCQL